MKTRIQNDVFNGVLMLYMYKMSVIRLLEDYRPINSVITGHSLGASIASGIGSNQDKIITYNKGNTIGQNNILLVMPNSSRNSFKKNIFENLPEVNPSLYPPVVFELIRLTGFCGTIAHLLLNLIPL
jgi:hypothetical protein